MAETETVDSRDMPPIDWYRTPIDRTLLRELTQRSDARALLHIGFFFGLLLLTGGLTYWAWLREAWWLVVVGCWLHATFWSFLAPTAATHELSHWSVFRTRGLNQFFGGLCGFLSWTDHISFRASHMWHHKLACYTGGDLEVVLPQTIQPHRWFFLLTMDPLEPWRVVRDFVQRARGIVRGEWPLWVTRDPQVRRRRKQWARVVLLGHVLLLALFIATGQWILILLVTLAPFYANWLATLVGHTQHAGMMPSVPDHRFSCRSVDLHPFLAFLYWNMNYHVEHHMYAGVPFYNLPRLHRAIAHDLPASSPGLWATWREIMYAQRRRASQPGFALRAVLPDSASPPHFPMPE